MVAAGGPKVLRMNWLLMVLDALLLLQFWASESTCPAQEQTRYFAANFKRGPAVLKLEDPLPLCAIITNP
jgi:hypothetical protein